ncbi:MAG TPA: hypothetical protein VGM02_08215 [Acidobacteriaceae bacterium]|jgi:hypothetical protein
MEKQIPPLHDGALRHGSVGMTRFSGCSVTSPENENARGMIAGVYSFYFQCSESGGVKRQVSGEISRLGFKVERRGFAQVDAGGEYVPFSGTCFLIFGERR